MKYKEIDKKNQITKIVKKMKNDNKPTVLNMGDTILVVNKFPGYKLFVYNINSKKSIKIGSIDEIDQLIKNNSISNLNFALLSRVDNSKKIINIWITPVVESA